MCLATVNETFDGTSKEVKFGYKVFREAYDIRARKPYMSFDVFLFNDTDKVPTEEWITAKSIPIGNSYNSGFHIFKYKKDAESRSNQYTDGRGAIIVKVKYKGVLAVGKQWNSEIIVAKHMFVPNVKF